MKYIKRLYFTFIVMPLATVAFIGSVLKDIWWLRNTDSASYKFWGK